MVSLILASLETRFAVVHVVESWQEFIVVEYVLLSHDKAPFGLIHRSQLADPCMFYGATAGKVPWRQGVSFVVAGAGVVRGTCPLRHSLLHVFMSVCISDCAWHTALCAASQVAWSIHGTLVVHMPALQNSAVCIVPCSQGIQRVQAVVHAGGHLFGLAGPTSTKSFDVIAPAHQASISIS